MDDDDDGEENGKQADRPKPDQDQKVLPVKDMTREQREHVAKGKDFADLPAADAMATTRDPTSTDIHGGKEFYHSPFAETVSDLGNIDNLNRTTPAVEEALPADEVASGPRLSKSERRREERAQAPTHDATPDISVDTLKDQSRYKTTRESPRDFDHYNPASSSVFDYLVDDVKTPIPGSSLGTAASTILSNGQPSSEPDTTHEPRFEDRKTIEEFSMPYRASTFNEAELEERIPRSKSGNASDPEDWERSSDSRKSKKKKASSKSDIGTSSKAASALAAAAIAAVCSYHCSRRRLLHLREEKEEV